MCVTLNYVCHTAPFRRSNFFRLSDKSATDYNNSTQSIQHKPLKPSQMAEVVKMF